MAVFQTFGIYQNPSSEKKTTESRDKGIVGLDSQDEKKYIKISQLSESKDSRRGQPGAHKGLSVVQQEHLDRVVNSTVAATTFMPSLTPITEVNRARLDRITSKLHARSLLHHLSNPPPPSPRNLRRLASRERVDLFKKHLKANTKGRLHNTETPPHPPPSGGGLLSCSAGTW